MKQVNENVKKMNQRSQSVLKSHTEFNHGFVNNQATTASIGSSTTQRANAPAVNQVPGSRSTVKGVVKSMGMKAFQGPSNQHQSTKQQYRTKKLVNLNEKVVAGSLQPSHNQNMHTQARMLNNSFNVDQVQSLHSAQEDAIHNSMHLQNRHTNSSLQLKQKTIGNPYTVDNFSKIGLNPSLTNSATQLHQKASSRSSNINGVISSRQEHSVSGYSNLHSNLTKPEERNSGLAHNGSVDRVYHNQSMILQSGSPDPLLGKAGQLDRSDLQHLSGSIDTNFIIKGKKGGAVRHGHQQSLGVNDRTNFENPSTAHQQYLRHLKGTERQKQSQQLNSHNNNQSMNIMHNYSNDMKGQMKYYANNAS